MKILYQIILAAIIIVILILHHIIGNDHPVLPSIVDAVLTVLMFTIYSYSFKYQAKYLEFSRKNMVKFFGTHILTTVLAAGFWVVATKYVNELIFTRDNKFYEFIVATSDWRFSTAILVNLMIIIFHYLIKYYNDYREKVENEAKLKNLITETELKTLKYQLNPHFIFNSLNSIAALTAIDSDKAGQMTIKLAEFLRSTLSADIKALIPFEDELKNIRKYISIERIRFEERFNWQENVDEECGSVLVPNMILQPLIENAIKYGLYESIDTIDITLSCEMKKSYMSIRVENNFDEDSVPPKGEGIGLKNIKERLRIIYDLDNLLETGKTENRFTAEIKVPLNKE